MGDNFFGPGTDSKEVAKILDKTEIVLKAFLELESVKGDEITKYRWDQPELLVCWKGEDGIERNIGFSVDKAVLYELQLQANAWLDNKGELKRKWRHFPFGTKVVFNANLDFSSLVVALIFSGIEEAFVIVNSVGEKDLTNESPLQPLPSGNS